MLLKFNPRISGGFIAHILRNPRLQKFIDELKDCDFSEKEIHEAYKDIIIAAFSEIKVDLNDEINKIKSKMQDADVGR